MLSISSIKRTILILLILANVNFIHCVLQHLFNVPLIFRQLFISLVDANLGITLFSFLAPLLYILTASKELMRNARGEDDASLGTHPI